MIKRVACCTTHDSPAEAARRARGLVDLLMKRDEEQECWLNVFKIMETNDRWVVEVVAQLPEDVSSELNPFAAAIRQPTSSTELFMYQNPYSSNPNRARPNFLTPDQGGTGSFFTPRYDWEVRIDGITVTTERLDGGMIHIRASAPNNIIPSARDAGKKYNATIAINAAREFLPADTMEMDSMLWARIRVDVHPSTSE